MHAAEDKAVSTEVKRAVSGEESLSSLFHKHFLLDTQSKRLARAVSVFEVQAPAKVVREVLTDFPKMPQVLKRVKSVEVVKNEGNMFFTQSYLKPAFLVNQPLNHTITDVCSKPNVIEWVLVDGNFPSASGRWEIEPLTAHSSKIKYTVAVEPGPFVPPHLVSFALKLVQKEVTNGMKERAEEVAHRLGIQAPVLPVDENAHRQRHASVQAHRPADAGPFFADLIRERL